MRTIWVCTLAMMVTACAAATAQPAKTLALAPGRAAQVSAQSPTATVSLDGPGTVVVSQGGEVRGAVIVTRQGPTTMVLPIAPLAAGEQPIDLSVLGTNPGELDLRDTLQGYCFRCNPNEPFRCCPWMQP